MKQLISIASNDLLQNNENLAFQKILNIVPRLTEMVISLLNIIPMLGQMGVELPQDIILAQLQNMTDAFEKKDVIMLFDSFNYEIGDTMQLYREILEQLEEENIQL